MTTINLHNGSESQLDLIKSLLEELNIKYDIAKSSDKLEDIIDRQKRTIQNDTIQVDEIEFFTEEESNQIIEDIQKI